jgi:hypothetical protein
VFGPVEPGAAQRIAVIGRLIAQTHHGLSAPIERAPSLAAVAPALVLQPAPMPSLGSGARRLRQCIDRSAQTCHHADLASSAREPPPALL